MRVQPSGHVRADLDVLDGEQGRCTLALLTGLTGKGCAVKMQALCNRLVGNQMTAQDADGTRSGYCPRLNSWVLEKIARISPAIAVTELLIQVRETRMTGGEGGKEQGRMTWG